MPVEPEWTGNAGLDLVTGGLPAHGLTMVIGPPGVGKTVLMLEIAMTMARRGRDIVYLSFYSEPHEKLIEHMEGFDFFDGALIGSRIELVSLKQVLSEGTDATLATIFRTVRGKNAPLIVIDGYRAMRNTIGPDAGQALIAGISSQAPYYGASCLLASESEPSDFDQYPDMASADAVIAIGNNRVGARAYRWLQVLKMRGHGFREGVHGMCITTRGVEVFPRLASLDLPPQVDITEARKCFGLPEFDAMLGGGIPELTTTLIFGDAGTGKTTFGLHFLMEGIQQGESGLLVTFHEPEPALLLKSRDLGLRLGDAVESGQVRVMRRPPMEIDPERLAWEILQVVARSTISRVVIDGITEIERAAGITNSPPDFLAALTEHLWRSGVTLLMIMDGVGLLPRGLLVPSTPATFIAQNRIVLRRVEYQGNLYRIGSVLNMQTSEHDTSIREFRIERGGVRVLPLAESASGVLAGITREIPNSGS